jgi:hypothetical protein
VVSYASGYLHVTDYGLANHNDDTRQFFSDRTYSNLAPFRPATDGLSIELRLNDAARTVSATLIARSWAMCAATCATCACKTASSPETGLASAPASPARSGPSGSPPFRSPAEPPAAALN